MALRRHTLRMGFAVDADFSVRATTPFACVPLFAVEETSSAARAFIAAKLMAAAKALLRMRRVMGLIVAGLGDGTSEKLRVER
jgi:hypothetical protein